MIHFKRQREPIGHEKTLAELESALAERQAEFRRQIENGQEKVKETQDAHAAARRELNAIRFAAGSDANAARPAIEQARRALLDENRPALDAFIERIEADEKRLRTDPTIRQTFHRIERVPGRIMDSFERLVVAETNHPSIGARLVALARLAQAATEIASTKANAAAEFERLWGELPPITLERVAA